MARSKLQGASGQFTETTETTENTKTGQAHRDMMGLVGLNPALIAPGLKVSIDDMLRRLHVR